MLKFLSDAKLEAGLLLDVIEHERNPISYILYKMGITQNAVLYSKNNNVEFELTRQTAIVKYNRKSIIFCYNKSIQFTINEIFVDEEYQKLNVRGKTVLDIGSGVGDTPIYFSVKGAKHVYGWDVDKWKYNQAIANINKNRIKNITLYNRSYNDSDLKINADVLKLDCEGCEYEFFSRYGKILKKFREIILEYHNNCDGLVAQLQNLGFITYTKKDKKYEKFGILYAKKSDSIKI